MNMCLRSPHVGHGRERIRRLIRPTSIRISGCLVCLLLALLAGCRRGHAEDARVQEPQARVTVIWVSIDGMRYDYPERAVTPTLDRLMQEGAYTRNLVPGFPSLTFPAHVSKATGVGVDQHGIPSNSFYDARRQRVYRYPPWAGMVEAEALWQTATRQGLRVAVRDWPLAHAQSGPHAAAYFLDRFDSGLSDRERLDALLDQWRLDQADVVRRAPLRLLATWIGDLDRAGHQYGPDAPEIADAMRETDALLGDLVERALAIWEPGAQEGDRLVLALTTDHGMSPVHTLVNLSRLMALPGDVEGLTLVTSGNIANLHLDGLADPDAAEALAARLLETAARTPYLRAYRRSELPERWEYAHPYRAGDLVMVLDTGYSFSARPREATAPVGDFGEPLGMHGYDPESDPNMRGFSVFWRYPVGWGGIELERVELRQLHPTLAQLLGIQPAPGADALSLALP